MQSSEDLTQKGNMSRYTMSKKRKARDRTQADWEQRLEIFRLRNQGWEFQKIADKLGTSKQNVNEIYLKIKDMDINKIENLAT